jgi:hypothetical protein
MDYSICRRQMSSLYVIEVECSILRINHLFQNGRALLKCQIFLPPTVQNNLPKLFYSFIILHANQGAL